MLHETSFQVIDVFSVGGQGRSSELMWHWLFLGWCGSDVYSKELKDLMGYIQSMSLYSCDSIKAFYFFALSTTIPHSKLKEN